MIGNGTGVLILREGREEEESDEEEGDKIQGCVV